MATYTYSGDISARTSVYAAQKLQERALAQVVTPRFAQAVTIPQKKSKTITFRRYESLASNIVALAEYQSDAGEKMTYSDVTATLEWYGKVLWISDVIQDTHEDPVLDEQIDLLAEWKAEVVEKININCIKAGTNKFLAGSAAARTSVGSVIAGGELRAIVRSMKQNRAKYISKIVKASAGIATEPVAPAFFALGHTDLAPDIRDLPGFIDAAYYSDSDKALPNELGKWEDLRFVLTDMFTPWKAAATSVSSTAFLSNQAIPSSASNPDVYPLIILGQNAFGTVSLQGKNVVQPVVVNPGKPTKDDPNGRKGFVSITFPYTTIILNQAYMYRYEVCATANP